MAKQSQETGLALRDAQGALALMDSQIAVIRATIAPDYKDEELALFLWYCHASGLDPFAREIHTWKDAKGRVVICRGIDGFRKRAAATGHYAPGGTRYEEDDKGRLVAAHVAVKRWMPEIGQWHECEEEARLAEFGRDLPTWKQMPRVMLAKCAEARALRRQFPAELGGLYVREEIEGAEQSRPTTRATRAARFAAQVETTATVVPPEAEPEPEETPGPKADTPRAAVMRQGLLLGATQAQILEIVEAAKRRGEVPKDSAEWTDDHARILICAIDEATRPEVQ